MKAFKKIEPFSVSCKVKSGVILQGHVLDVLKGMEADSVDCVVTSPPYWGLRDYKIEPQVWDAREGCEHEWETEQRNGMSGGPSDKQESNKGSWHELHEHSFCLRCGAWRGSLGLEPTPELFVKHTVQVFAEVKRVLKPTGVCFVNLGSSYMGSGGAHKEHHANPGLSKSFSRDGYVHGISPIRSHGGVETYGNDDKVRSDYQEIDPSCCRSGDERQGDFQNHHDHNVRNDLEHHEASWPLCKKGHDIGLQDSEEASLDVLPLSSQESTIHESSELPLDGYCRISNGVCDPFVCRSGVVGDFECVYRVLNNGDKPLNACQSGSYHKQDTGLSSKAYKLPPSSIKDSLQTMFCDVKFKPKDLVPIPWMVALALQADGWWLRSDIIWAKPNPMPESVTDRPTKSHEYIFLLTKAAKYFFDQEAVREKASSNTLFRGSMTSKSGANGDRNDGGRAKCGTAIGNRNIRSVWTFATEPTPEAHFATFPQELVKRCILAGTSEKGCCPKCGKPWEPVVENEVIGRRDFDGIDRGTDKRGIRLRCSDPEKRTTGWRPTCSCGEEKTVPAVVLDPFIGSGTTGIVAENLYRKWIGIELNPEYIEIAEKRIWNRGRRNKITSQPSDRRIRGFLF